MPTVAKKTKKLPRKKAVIQSQTAKRAGRKKTSTPSTAAGIVESIEDEDPASKKMEYDWQMEAGLDRKISCRLYRLPRFMLTSSARCMELRMRLGR